MLWAGVGGLLSGTLEKLSSNCLVTSCSQWVVMIGMTGSFYSKAVAYLFHAIFLVSGLVHFFHTSLH